MFTMKAILEQWTITALCMIVLLNLCSALRCVQSTSEAGKETSKLVFKRNCKSYKEFENIIRTVVMSARDGVIAASHNNLNVTNGTALHRNKEGWRRIAKRSVSFNRYRPGLKATCATVIVKINEVTNKTSGEIRRINASLRDCVLVPSRILRKVKKQVNNCKAPVVLENASGNPPITGTRYVCMCNEDDCNAASKTSYHGITLHL